LPPGKVKEDDVGGLTRNLLLPFDEGGGGVGVGLGDDPSDCGEVELTLLPPLLPPWLLFLDHELSGTSEDGDGEDLLCPEFNDVAPPATAARRLAVPPGGEVNWVAREAMRAARWAKRAPWPEAARPMSAAWACGDWRNAAWNAAAACCCDSCKLAIALAWCRHIKIQKEISLDIVIYNRRKLPISLMLLP
jgi:hypothetical protein